jgi:hypothetical protein
LSADLVGETTAGKAFEVVTKIALGRGSVAQLE